MKKQFLTLIIAFSLTNIAFISCDTKEEYTRDSWVGRWKLQDNVDSKIHFKASSGNIAKDPNNTNQIIIDGDLFSLSRGSFHATVSGENATFDEKNSYWHIKGSANMRSKNEILFTGSFETEEEIQPINGLAIRL